LKNATRNFLKSTHEKCRQQSIVKYQMHHAFEVILSNSRNVSTKVRESDGFHCTGPFIR